MITPVKRVRAIDEWSYKLPISAKDLYDAVISVENVHNGNSYDDRYYVKSDGESLTFYWEED